MWMYHRWGWGMDDILSKIAEAVCMYTSHQDVNTEQEPLIQYIQEKYKCETGSDCKVCPFGSTNKELFKQWLLDNKENW